MHVLFIHKNFPAQFRYLAPRLVREYGWRCSFLTAQTLYELPGVEKLLYEANGGATKANHPYSRNFENTVVEAAAVYERLKQRPELQPDLIVAHAGFGSSLFLPYLYDAPIINFFEYYYRAVGGDLGYRPEFAVEEDSLLRLRTKNAMLLLDLDNCTQGWTPTEYQRNYFPREWQSKINAIFDGIDTDIYYRRPDARARLARELDLPDEARVVTYVARGFEFMRGFDIFMDAAKKIAADFPNVVFVVVGGDTTHYGNDQARTGGKPLREFILSRESFDLSRFRFTGFVSEDRLAEILSLSDVHIYLTEPFIASWSMVDAMSCGAVLVASDQTCVREYVVPGENGLLVDFFDVDALARQVVEVLRDPPAYRHLGDAATRTVAEKYSVDVAMPKLVQFFERVQSQSPCREPSLLLSNLVRSGQPGHLTGGEPDVDGSLDTGPARLTEAAPDDVSHQAARQLKEFVKDVPDVELAATLQRFRGPAPWFLEAGPWNHPVDLTRMLNRVREWKPRTIVDVGDDGGGRTVLWSRAAADDARIILAGVPSGSAPVFRMTFFNGLARAGQSVRCVTRTGQLEIHQRVSEMLSNKWIDLLWIDGLRPFLEVARDFESLGRLVRKGGLIGWDGIGGSTAPDPQHDGGYRLWSEVKARFPKHAEYLSGVNQPRRGIALIVMR
jgi:glycosyltransferase involved in cell wall biosynthesis